MRASVSEERDGVEVGQDILSLSCHRVEEEEGKETEP